jgi:hypothetical protein
MSLMSRTGALPGYLVLAGGIVPTGCASQFGWPVTLGACRPAYVATKFATSSACFPTTTFWGMIAPEKPPFSIAYSTRVTGRSQRTLKFGPFVISRERTFAADPCVAAYESVWHPEHRWLNRTAPSRSGLVFGTLMLWLPHATASTATAADAHDMRRTLIGRLMRAENIRK